MAVAENLNKTESSKQASPVCSAFLCLETARCVCGAAARHEGVWGGTEASLHSFLASALEGGEWSASRPSGFTHWENSSWYRF